MIATPSIDRINEMVRTARASWFGLISYLAFVGVTLMGVQDEDFFLIEKETPLPLIGVSIPTSLFFYVAPILGAALFAYFHLHLLKLWEALADALEAAEARGSIAPLEPLPERVTPWLVVDFALAHRKGALRRRPAQWLSRLVTLALAFLATPIVLGFFWWRSMPAHDAWLTLGACGLSLAVTLYLALVSWARMRGLVAKGRRMRDWRGGLAAGTGIALLCAISLIGWFRVGEPLSHYYIAWVLETRDAEEIAKALRPKQGFRFADRNDLALLRIREGHENEIEGTLWSHPLLSLASADLAGVNFSYTPEDWLGYEAEKLRAHAAHCEAAGVSPALCTHLDTDSEDLTTAQTLRRLDFCKATFGRAAGITLCHTWFADTAAAFEADWPDHWRTMVRALESRDLRGKDFRNANLFGAEMQGANLREAEMQGANLVSAEMQGADLRWARMQGANLSLAEMQEAYLVFAQMQRARLLAARMQGANLVSAQMQGANLFGAQLQGADLREAEMQGANIVGAQMQGANHFSAQLQGANLFGAHLPGADLRRAQMQGAVLGGAQMQGADLTGAQMQGAVLGGAQMDESTDLRAATLRGAALRSVDDTTIAQLKDHWHDIFADGTVVVADGQRPAHWADEPLEDTLSIENGMPKLAGPFTDAWRAWQRSIGMDPENPE